MNTKGWVVSIGIALLLLPGMIFSVQFKFKDEGQKHQEVFTKKEISPIVLVALSDTGVPLRGYKVRISPFSSDHGKFKSSQIVTNDSVITTNSLLLTDEKGEVTLRFKAGSKMKTFKPNFVLLDREDKIVAETSGTILILKIIDIIFYVLGGLAIFLFGINMMSDGLKAVAGESMKTILGFLTQNRLMGVLLGFTITAAIQSSSATTVMVVGFINAGLMNLAQSVGVIMGANIGTTITAQLIAFKIKEIALPAIAIGFVFIMITKNKNIRFWGEVILGFGLLFLGMNTMSDILKPLASSPTVSSFFINFSYSPILGLFAGALATLIIQSSSATVGLTMALASSGLIDIGGMFPIILGDNIGTTITAQLAALNANKTAKQAAWVHTMFNLVGSFIMLIFVVVGKDKDGISWYYRWIGALSKGSLVTEGGRIWYSGNVERFVANSHMFFNILATIVFLPFGNVLAKIAQWIVPQGKEETHLKYLEPHLIDTPALALIQSKKEIHRMLEIAEKMLKTSMEALMSGSIKKAGMIPEQEDLLDKIQYETTQYLLDLPQEFLKARLNNQIPKLIHCANDVERIGDLSENIYHLAEKLAKDNTKLPKNERKKIDKMVGLLLRMFHAVVDAIPTEDKAVFESILKYENRINKFYQKKKVEFFESISEKSEKHEVASRLIFVDTLNYMEKIGDYLTNVCQAFIHLDVRLVDDKVKKDDK